MPCGDKFGNTRSVMKAGLSFWLSPQAIKDQYGNASICNNNRVVLNIGGNKYRLVVEMQYRAGIAWIKFVGTHAEYDMIDVETVNDY
jgi:mRNA interferase HigB